MPFQFAPIRAARGAAAVIVLIALLVMSAAAQSARPRIVNGVLTSAYATTGLLLNGSTFDTATSWCTGTLIGCNTFLTAQHCVDGYQAGDFKVFLQHGGMFDVESIARAAGFDFPIADIAVLKLSTAVSGIPPSRINTVEDPPFGTAGTIVGFGRRGGTVYDYGLKRVGAVVTGACETGISDTTSVCWSFNSPEGDPGTNSNTCNGDSGGPLFLNLGGKTVVAGVTSGGDLDSCLVGDRSFDADVYHYRSFILNAGGADVDNQTCGAISQVGDSDTQVRSFAGQLSSAAPDAVHSFEVPSSAQILRVALNGIDDGRSDFDLYVKRGSQPTPFDYDCAREGSNQFGVCEVNNPQAGTWYALVHRFGGSGAYQVTATSFGPPCDDGEACDDGNACTSDDTCVAGVCAGTAVSDGTSCGDGDLCTGELTCQSGSCNPSNKPRTNCRRSLSSTGAFLMLRANNDPTRDRLLWRWQKGQETLSFGDPTSNDDFALCVYDQSSGVDRLVMSESIPAGSHWSAANGGWRYSDRTGGSDGIRSVRLRTGSDQHAAITISGKGAGLNMQALPLLQDSAVVVQFVDADECWESRYTNSLQNDARTFKSKGN